MGWKLTAVILIVAFVIYRKIDRFDPDVIKGKSVVITGASSGIGEQLAYQYAKLGARILITARREKELQRVVSECIELGAKEAHYISLDMSRPEDAKKLVDEAEDKLGGLDHLILNHVYTIFPLGFWAGDFDLLEKTMDTNFRSYVRIATYATPMLNKTGGSIGVVSSGVGKFAFPLTGAYCASKFALHGFFDTLRLEYGIRQLGISVSLFVLGIIDTASARANTADILDIPEYTSASDTALVILKGTANREREVFYPSYVIMVCLRDIAPWLIEYINSASLIPEAMQRLMKNLETNQVTTA